MSKNNIGKLSFVVLIILFLLTSCSKKEEILEEEILETHIPVEVEKITQENLKNTRTFNGQIVPNKEVMVIPKMVGSVDSLTVKLGDYVKEGQTLFTIEQDEITKNLEQSSVALELATQGVNQAENSINTAEINKTVAEENLSQAEKDFDRMNTLYKEGAIPKSQVEQSELALHSAETQLKTVTSQIAQAKISLEQAQSQVKQSKVSHDQIADNLKHTSIKSPITGVIAHLDIKEGEIATNTQPAMIIVDLNKVFLQFQVVEDVVNHIKIGQNIIANIPAAFSDEVDSKITYISPTADVANKLYSVKAEINNKDRLAKPGMSGNAILNIDELNDVIALSRNTILETDDTQFVFVVENNKAIKKIIQTGATFTDFIEVKEGIAIGDNVIIKGHHYVDDGKEVKIVGGDDN